MENIAQWFGLFGDMAFPVVVAGFLLVSTSKQLEKMRASQIKQIIMLAMLLKAHDLAVPDTKIEEFVKLLMDD